MATISSIEGIGPAMAEKLATAGVKKVESLLEVASTKAGRKGLAETTGISESRILRWTNMADLFRVKGIGEEYADLLEAAGVDTVPALARRNAENLTTKMAEINDVKNLTRRVPSAKQVASWIDHAKSLPRVLEY